MELLATIRAFFSEHRKRVFVTFLIVGLLFLAILLINPPRPTPFNFAVF